MISGTMRIRPRTPDSRTVSSLCRFVALVVISASLGAATTAQPSAADHVIDLSFNADLAAQGFPSPLLRATVNGHVVWFLMDTGASVHTLATWFVTSAHIATRESKMTLVGSTGATTHAKEAGPFQFLTRDGSPFSVEVAKLGMTAAAATTGTHVCPTEDPSANGRTYGVPATIAGIPADMTADTGATSTTVASTRIARALASRAVANGEIQGVGGDAQKAKTVAGVTVVRAGVARKADVLLSGSSGGNCGVDGLLGMDALRGCTMVLAEKTMGISCGGS